MSYATTKQSAQIEKIPAEDMPDRVIRAAQLVEALREDWRDFPAVESDGTVEGDRAALGIAIENMREMLCTMSDAYYAVELTGERVTDSEEENYSDGERSGEGWGYATGQSDTGENVVDSLRNMFDNLELAARFDGPTTLDSHAWLTLGERVVAQIQSEVLA